MYLKNVFKELHNLDEEFESFPRDIPDDVDDSEMYESGEEITDAEYAFANLVEEFLLDLIKDENLEESFKDSSKLNDHYLKHCLANNPEHISKRTNIYYDFNSIKEYENYEKEIRVKIKSDDSIILDSLLNIEDVIEGFRKLFEGSCTLIFSRECGFKSADNKYVSIAFNAFANEATTNYEDSNTVNYIVYEPKHTKTLFALDASYVENKFNNLVKKWNSKYNQPFKINR